MKKKTKPEGRRHGTEPTPLAGRRLADWLRQAVHDVVEARERGPDPGDQELLRTPPLLFLARNDPPDIACVVCGKPAKKVCTECLFGGEGALCSKCTRQHECDEEMMLPLVNSPRTGMCAYAG